MYSVPKLILGVAALAVLSLPTTSRAQTMTLPELPYSYDALAPVIDPLTMETHHSKHHQAFVTTLNTEIAADPALKDLSVEDILVKASTQKPAVRNTAGGHWNHTFFWNIMAPEGSNGEMSEALKAAINEKFGSLEAMQEAFNTAGAGRFGSGWVWLVVNDDNTLDIVATPYQDNPLMDDAPHKGTPILGNDVWEHAYYITYQNRRPEYLKNWWRVVNWDAVSKHYEAATKN